MADQKNEDNKNPFPRRGARPFGGPPSASAPSRPFIRPVTVLRPTAAPFVAPVGPGKLVLRNAAPAPAAKIPTPVAPPSVSSAPSADIGAPSRSTRPLTSETSALEAIDAIDAFDAVWGVSEPAVRAVEPAPVAAPLDELSLGSGSDGQQPCADDITATDTPAEKSGVATAATFESSDAAVVSPAPAWLEDDVVRPAVPTEDPVESEITQAVNDAPPPTAVKPISGTDAGYGFGEWTDAHTIPAFDEIMGVVPEQPIAPVQETLGEALPTRTDWTDTEGPDSAEPTPRFELVALDREPQPEAASREEPQAAEVAPAPVAEMYSPRAARIAATFDRLADRVRSREIDVSSIAPEATDAAVLASVLAALLGGSRSR